MVDPAGDVWYVWNSKTRKYREMPSGRTLLAWELQAAQESIVLQQAATAQSLAASVVAEEIGVDQFVDRMRDRIRLTSLESYMAERGGRRQMTQADYGRVGALVRREYQYLNRFADDLNNQTMTQEQAEARAEMYIESTRGMEARGRAAAWGVRLPVYPPRHVHCRCSWEFEDTEDGVIAWWRTDDNPCEECEALEDEHSPFRT